MKRLLPAIALVSLVCGSGCDLLVSGESDVSTSQSAGKPTESASAKGGSGKETDPLLAAIAAQEKYSYNPVGKRDPFQSFLTQPSDSLTSTPRTPLQQYDIDQYQLVGIVTGIPRPRALVEDPEGIGHVMEIGTYIGKNWGKVTAINPDSVVVTEEYQTISGDLVVNSVTMHLPTAGTAGRTK